MHTLRLTVEGNEEHDMPEDVSLCIFRVLQEALLNVQKHACAGQVNVRLCINPEEVGLSVEDDGQGFTAPLRLGQLTGSGHFGLVGLRERLTQVNGKLAITALSGRGTRLEAHVPLTVSYTH
jgi:signal transduction histidine kinase